MQEEIRHPGHHLAAGWGLWRVPESWSLEECWSCPLGYPQQSWGRAQRSQECRPRGYQQQGHPSEESWSRCSWKESWSRWLRASQHNRRGNRTRSRRRERQSSDMCCYHLIEVRRAKMRGSLRGAQVTSHAKEALQDQEVTLSAEPAISLQLVLQPPQDVGRVRSVSHPLVMIESQF